MNRVLAQIAERLLQKKQVSLIQYSLPLEATILGQTHYQIACRLSGPKKNAEGYGIDTNPKAAKLKALMEAIERFALEESSNPCHSSAAHFSRGLAIENAYKEMIERDAYIRWALGLNNSLRSWCKEEIFVHQLVSRDEDIIVVLAAKVLSSCIVFGLGSHKNLEEAQFKALSELGQSLIRHKAHACGQAQGLYAQVHRLTSEPAFHQKITGHFSSGETSIEAAPALKFISSTLPGCHRWPISVVAMSCPDLFQWDLNWFQDTQGHHPINSRLLLEYGKGRQLKPIPVG